MKRVYSVAHVFFLFTSSLLEVEWKEGCSSSEPPSDMNNAIVLFYFSFLVKVKRSKLSSRFLWFMSKCVL